MIKICQECGLEFEATNGNQKFCKRVHFRTCKVCGKQFEVTQYHLTAKDAKVTCSRRCSNELRRQTCLDRYGGVAPAVSEEIQSKMRATTMERFGVEYAAQSTEVMDKTKQTNIKRYGAEFYTMTNEGKQRIAESWEDAEKRRARLNKMKSTNLMRYGFESCLSNEDVRNKARDTYESKTGYREPFANPEVQSKSEETNLKRYGTRRPLQSEAIKEKAIQTNLGKYGTKNPVQNINVSRKIQQTCFERYGNTCYLQSELGKQAVADSMISKYQHRWFSQTPEWKTSRMIDPSKIDNLLDFREDPASYLSANYNDKPSIRELASDIGVHENTVGQLLIEHNCSDLVNYVYSYMEEDVYNFISSLDADISIERNTHKVITPQELDIYIPKYRIGIECNPTSTHNSSINTFDINEAPTKYNYHLMKTEKCEDAGIFLFHIFGSEWTYSRPIIESMIRNLLGKCERKIYARKCSVKEIDWKTCKDFLDTNHRQGNANSRIRLGLYLGDELVSVMTFGRMRNTIGTDNTDLSDCWELVRFCSLLNTSVVGGASKLFKHFLREYSPARIRSFSDRAHTRGGLYEKLGFVKIRESEPGYVWVDSRTDISYHRYSAQKQNIKKFLHDDNIDLSKTEKQIMEEHGFLQVYDCGTILWEYFT